MTPPLLLPFYYKETIGKFWTGELIDALTEEVDINTITPTFKKLKEEIRGKNQYTLIAFLLGLDALSSYSPQHAQTLEAVQSKLPKLLGKLKFSIETLIEVIQLLNALIDYGNVRGFWNLNLILKVEKIPRIKNPMGSDEDWQKVIYCSELVAHLGHSGYQDIATMSPPEKFALITLSLIFDSQIIRFRSLIAILKKINDTNNFNYLNGNLFFLVSPDDFNAPKKIFISKKTEVLLYQAGINSNILENIDQKDFLNFIKDAIKAYLKRSKFTFSIMPKTLFQWCQWAYIFHHQNTPPLIINYRSGMNKSHSLNPQATQRVYSIDLSDSGEVYVKEKPRGTKVRNTSYALKIIQQIFDIKVKNSNALIIKQNIENSASKILFQLPNNHQLILNWGISLLAVNKSKKFKVGPSQILTKIYSVARHLIGIADQSKIQSLPPQERMSLYDAVTEQAISSRNRETILYNLKAFNTWLEKSHHALPIPNKDDYFGHPKVTDLTVNANLIHFDEYNKIKSIIISLCEKSPFNEVFKMMLMALILGFRCGLRSKEAFQLKIDDFIFCHSSPQIAIRESDNREIKTQNAKRFLKLVDHMPMDEVNVLRDWYLAKTLEIKAANSPNGEQDETQPNHYFFSVSGRNEIHINIEKIKAPLMGLIRQVCQDTSLNFHHLRHSFASWHFLSACTAELNLDTAAYFEHLPETKNWLKNANTRKIAHLPTHLKSKKYPFWISKKMGHASFNTTFEHYTHTTDIIALALLQQTADRLTIQEIAQFSNISVSTLKKQKNRLEYAISRHIKNHKILNKARLHSLAPKEAWQPPKVNMSEYQTPMQEFTMYNMMELFHLASESTLIDEHALHLGFSKPETLKVIDLFKCNSKYRLRRPFSEELTELHRLTQALKDLYQIDFNNLKGNLDFLSLLNTFSNRFFPYERDLDSLAVQKNYHLVFNDITSSTILMDAIRKLKIPFSVTFRHSKKWDQKELLRARKFWREALELTPKFRIDMKPDSKKLIGPNGRIEIIFKNEAGHRNHAFYYLFVMLSAWWELNNEIA